jgi:replicative DNA helicase
VVGTCFKNLRGACVNIFHRLLNHVIAWSDDDQSTDALERCESEGLKPEHFFSPQANGFCLKPTPGALLFRCAIEHYQKTAKRIPLHELNQRVRLSGAPPDIREESNSVIAAAAVASSNGSDVENIIEEIKKQYSASSLRATLADVVSREQNFLDTDPDAVRERLINALQDGGAGTTDSKLVVAVNDPAYVQRRIDGYGKRSEEAEKGLKTGFPTLDAAIGGLRPGELTLICSQQKSGKSATWMAMAGHMVTSAEDAGVECDAIVANREMTLDRQLERLECWFMNRFIKKKHKGSLTDRIHTGSLYDDELIAYAQGLEHMASMKNKVWMIDPRAYENIDDLEAILVRYKSKRPVKALYVDSLNDQALARYGSFVDKKYQALEEISRRLDRIAVKHQVTVIAEVQEKADSANTRWLKLSELFADSSAIGRPITHALRIFQVPEGEGLVEFQMVASRFCAGGWGFPVFANIGDMRIEEAPAEMRDTVNSLCDMHTPRKKW